MLKQLKKNAEEVMDLVEDEYNQPDSLHRNKTDAYKRTSPQSDPIIQKILIVKFVMGYLIHMVT